MKIRALLRCVWCMIGVICIISCDTGETGGETDPNPNNTIDVTAVNVQPSTITLTTGATAQLTVEISPANATHKTVSWTSANDSIVTVDSMGKISAHASGSTVITATSSDGKISGSCEVIVDQGTVHVSGVAITTNIDLEIGDTRQLTPVISPDSAVNKAVSWVSDRPDIASVNDAGLVTAITSGKALIKVTSNDSGVFATCEVSVALPKSWKLVGSNDISPAAVTDFTMALGSDGLPIIAYIDTASGDKLSVRKLVGDSWASIGDSYLTSKKVTDISLAVAPDGTPFVAYIDDESMDLYVKSFSGGTWNTLGGGAVVDWAYNACLAVDNNGIPFIAYGQSYGYIRKLVNGVWTSLGTYYEGTASPIKMMFDHDNALFLLHFGAHNFQLSVKSYYPSASGISTYSADFTPLNTYYADIAVDIYNNLVCVYSNPDDSQRAKVVFKPASWAQIGDAASFSDAKYQSIAAAPDGTLYVAYCATSYVNSRYYGRVMKKTGGYLDGLWSDAGDTFGANIEKTDIEINSQGSMYIVYKEHDDSGKVKVVSFR